MKNLSLKRAAPVLIFVLCTTALYLGYTGEELALDCAWTKAYEKVVCTLSRKRLVNSSETVFELGHAETQRGLSPVADRFGWMRSMVILITSDGEIRVPVSFVEPKLAAKQLDDYLGVRSTDQLNMTLKDNRSVNYIGGTFLILTAAILAIKVYYRDLLWRD